MVAHAFNTWARDVVAGTDGHLRLPEELQARERLSENKVNPGSVQP